MKSFTSLRKTMLSIECFTFSNQNTAMSVLCLKQARVVSKLFAAGDCLLLTVLTKQL